MTHGSYAVIKLGATAWMIARGYLTKEDPSSVDLRVVRISADYTSLPGDSSHFCCELDGLEIGVHPQFLVEVSL